jgi:ATP-dependent RNA helicase DDX10/DBP4
MATPVNGRKSKPQGRGKSDVRSLKRKRDNDEHETLSKAVENLVSIPRATIR